MAFAVFFNVLLRFLKDYFLNNTVATIMPQLIALAIRNIMNMSILDMIFPRILWLPLPDNHEDVADDPDSEDFSDEVKEGLSDSSSDSEETKEVKNKIRDEKRELDKMKQDRKKINEDHSTAQDKNDHEKEEREVKKLESLDKEIEEKKEDLL